MNIPTPEKNKSSPTISPNYIDLTNMEKDDATLSAKMEWACQFWDHLKGNHDMPARRDFTPADILPIMQNIALVDVSNKENKGDVLLKFRLVASGLTNLMGRDYTGEALVEIPGMESSLDKIKTVIHKKEAIYYSSKGLPWKPSWVTPFKFMAFPFSEDGNRVNMIMLYVE